jgi:Tfp pilus assembly protein PilX
VSRRPRLESEAGVALVVAMVSLALMITLGGVALKQAVGALHHTNKEMNVKRALQAADAAIDSATYTLIRADVANTVNINPQGVSAAIQNCVVTTGAVGGIDTVPLDPLSPPDPGGNKWCPENSSETTSDNATYSYRISQLLRAGAGPCGASGLINLDRDVVGVGQAGGEVRRVKAHLRASIALLSGAAVQSSSTSPLTLAGTAKILGDAESNGPITGAGANVISGNATPGYTTTGTPYTVSGVVAGGSTSPACQTFSIPEVSTDAISFSNPATTITKSCVDTVTFLTLPCKPLLVTTGGADYDPVTRTLDVWGNGRAVLTGTNYSFCHLKLRGNGVLQIPNSSAVVRIFLDDPENCKTGSTYFPGAGTINLSEGARILNCHPQTQPETLQLYAIGNSTTGTTQTLASAGLLTGALRGVLCGLSLPAIVGEPMVVVAPKSSVDIGGSTAISGQVAAQTVHMSGLSSVNPINALANLNRLGSNPVLPLYKATDYVECTGRTFTSLPANDPSQGC